MEWYLKKTKKLKNNSKYADLIRCNCLMQKILASSSPLLLNIGKSLDLMLIYKHLRVVEQKQKQFGRRLMLVVCIN